MDGGIGHLRNCQLKDSPRRRPGPLLYGQGVSITSNNMPPPPFCLRVPCNLPDFPKSAGKAGMMTPPVQLWLGPHLGLPTAPRTPWANRLSFGAQFWL